MFSWVEVFLTDSGGIETNPKGMFGHKGPQ